MQRKTEEEDEQISLKRNTTTSFLQRKCTSCEEEENVQRKEKEEDDETLIKRKPLRDNITPFVQAKSESVTTASNDVAGQIQSSRGNGSMLDRSTQSFMSSRFGTDFSQVKVHTGGEAAELSSKLNAKAFTVGSDIYFNQGQYAPETISGKELLAHELTHVVQQTPFIQSKLIQRHTDTVTYTAFNTINNNTLVNSSVNDNYSKEAFKKEFGFNGKKINTKLAVAPPDDPFEEEAETVAEQIMRMPEQEHLPARFSLRNRNETIDENDKRKEQNNIQPTSITDTSTNTCERCEENNQLESSLTDNVNTKQPQVAANAPETATKTRNRLLETTEYQREVNRPETTEETLLAETQPETQAASTISRHTTAEGVSDLQQSGSELSFGGAAAMPETAELDSSSSEGLLHSLASLEPVGFVQGMSRANEAVSQIQNREVSDLQASLPEVTQPTGLPVTQAESTEAEISLPSAETPELGAEGEEQGALLEERHIQPESDVSLFAIATPRARSEDDPEFSSHFRQAIRELPTSDSTITTSAGPRPQVDTTGAANPIQNTENQLESNELVMTQEAEANTLISQDFGENNIFPYDRELEQLRPAVDLSVPPDRQASTLEPLPQTTPEVYAGFNDNVRASLDEQIAVQQERQATEQENMETASEAERQRGFEQIEAENQRTREEQLSIQSTAREEVQTYRTQWREENDAVREEYSTQSSERRTEVDREVDEEIRSTEAQVNEHLTNAEQRAEQERVNTEREAERRRAEAERQEQESGFWDTVTSAVSNFFDALRDGLNALFDGLRQIVSSIIEAAKSIVNTLIDAARRVLISVIEAFGEFLKGLVSIALAAFPEIAERINGLIDDAVSVAVDGVNALADALKAAVSAILDAVGAVLDSILAAYQAIFNAVLDVLEFITVGLIEIIRGIANLAEAAYNMPDFFMGQLSEEVLGFDLTQPLPGIERTQPVGNTVQAECQTMTVQAENASLLNQTRLEDEDVVVEPVADLELDPELINSLALTGDGEIEFGEPSPDDITTEEIRASALPGQPSSTQTAPAVTDTAEGGNSEAQTDTTPGSGQDVPDFCAMTDEEKLNYYLSRMDSPQCDDRPSESPSQQTEEVPDIAKVGPLTVQQRADFMLGQMRRGISNWWECNKTMIIIAAVAVLVGLGIATILTGGAILALLPPLLTALTYIFMAWLAARMGGKIGEYLTKAWSGDIEGGARALARALAIGVSELIFNVIFKVGGIILRVVRRVITLVGRAARAVGRGAMRAGRAIGRGIAQGGRALARGIAGAGRRAGGYLIRQGRVVFRGLSTGFARGVRSLRELGQRLKSWYRFRGIVFRIRGRRIYIYGRFDPLVLIGTSRITQIDEATWARQQRRIGEEIMTPEGTGRLLSYGDELSEGLRETILRNSRQGRRDLFDLFEIRPGQRLNLDVPSAPDGRSYITYAFKNAEGQIVYIGRASGPGNPRQVLSGRLGRGHDHFRSGLTPEVIAVQSSKRASQGAEEFFSQGYRTSGSSLTNIDAPLSIDRSSRRLSSMAKMNQFFREISDILSKVSH